MVYFMQFMVFIFAYCGCSISSRTKYEKIPLIFFISVQDSSTLDKKDSFATSDSGFHRPQGMHPEIAFYLHSQQVYHRVCRSVDRLLCPTFVLWTPVTELSVTCETPLSDTA